MALTRLRDGPDATAGVVSRTGFGSGGLAAASAAILLSLAVWLFANPDVRLDPAGLPRILWQLAKATSASIVLAVGCWALFGSAAASCCCMAASRY